MNKLYWKAFGVLFSATFLSFGSVALFYVWISWLIESDIPLKIVFAGIVVLSLLFAWAWIALLANSPDHDTRMWQLQVLEKDGMEMLVEANFIGWLILLAAKMGKAFVFAYFLIRALLGKDEKLPHNW